MTWNALTRLRRVGRERAARRSALEQMVRLTARQDRVQGADVSAGQDVAPVAAVEAEDRARGVDREAGCLLKQLPGESPGLPDRVRRGVAAPLLGVERDVPLLAGTLRQAGFRAVCP